MPARIDSLTREGLAGHAVDLDCAAVGRDDAAKNLHQGGLAGAVLADDADHLAGTHLQVEAGERDDARINLAYVAQPQEWLCLGN